MKPTIKEVNADGFVVKTLQRAALMEVQTPQVRYHQPLPPSKPLQRRWKLLKAI